MKLTDAKFLVIDTETTGLDPAVDRIVEVGTAIVSFHKGARRFATNAPMSELCNPGRDIPPVAKAVHHIREAMVVEARTPEVVLAEHEFRGCNCYAAHNAEFDRGMVAAAGFDVGPWLCTMRLAKHAYPDAPGYGNEVLRYWLGYDVLPFEAGEPEQVHRAGHDVGVTALLLTSLLDRYVSSVETVEELIALAESPVILKGQVGFGKHFDKTWPEVAEQDRSYLHWIRRQRESEWDRDVWHTVRHLLGEI